ncbi:MAG: bifunctional acetate--CoA ligase family protein/GNAT family N-acetyltransferase [Alphaproteobacteria bacterium]|uniref:Bifunctional acetate--CoA ligase family protein/GNAT family N-acetyltransferase n=1 Tax=Candidatus Nitrobium versatile TaxID=2884831 RepID=A0A953JB06_9BACT|nr:bifunctional acetate--CoA ligase family protein/GNAT family N-acetyltransferase [Candidatus Nitrobium versatile]
MSVKNLEFFFNPRRIAVIGAGEDPGSVGYALLRNMIGKGFRGVVYPVNPSLEAVQGIEAYKHISAIPHPVDLAVLTTPVEGILPALEECGHKGVKGVSIISPDFENRTRDYRLMEEQIQQLALKHEFRVLGPNTLGFIRPGTGLNASLFPGMPQKGSIAFISQSATLTAALLDRAVRKNVGLSYVVSLGAKLDLGFSDLIDFLGVDPETKAIILYLEYIRRGRKFMTAVKSFARSKPIVVVKSGKFALSAQVSLTHSGFLAGEDKVYDAVIKRAGAVRIDEILDLFYLAETLAKQRRPKGKRLAIVTNAGAPSILALDTLLRLEGEPARLREETLENLRRSLPLVRQVNNPLNLLTSASPDDYKAAIQHCLKDPSVEGLLVMHVRYFGSRTMEIAEAVAAAARENPYIPLFTVWMGGDQSLAAMDYMNQRGVPTFITPEQAVRSFIYLYRYDYNLQMLQETPEAILKDFVPDDRRAGRLINAATREGRRVLHLNEVKEILRAYGIPAIPTRKAGSEEEAVGIAGEIGYPVVLKIDSEKIFHKLEKGGVFLNLKDDAAVREAFGKLQEIAVSHEDPNARVLIQPMVIKHGFELVIGAKKDPTFGSVIVFGTGGELLEALGDYAVGLPPLNQTLARRMMEETKIYQYLQHQGTYGATLRLLEEMLVRFSYLIIDFPCIREIDINPFLITGKEGFALDAGILLEADRERECALSKEELCPPHLSICPYPFKYMKEVALDGVTAVIRPIRPEDEPLVYDLFKGLSEDTIMFRFCQRLTDMPHERLVRYCQLDYDREMAFVAVLRDDPDRERVIADVRIIKMPDLETAELAILVADEWQGHGIGTMLVEYCIEIAREMGVRTLWMEILRNNNKMLHLARTTGFSQVYADEDMVKVVRKLS